MAKTNFPSFNEYQSALQNPQFCFNSAELKSSTVETDLWGLPRVRSGGFALTYKLTNHHQQLAVRCFHSFVPDRAQRYIAIGSFLRANPSDIFIPIQFNMTGVLVRGNWYPITYMKWVEGDTLEAYIVKNVKKQELIRDLLNEFLRVISEMEKLGVSHGDLSHRNVIVHNGKMILVDYDGMFVPSLDGRKSSEIGNINFQLPNRAVGHFNAKLDRFSAIVIYLALHALSQRPDLLDRYETGGEGLLFSNKDFLNPYQSLLLQELETYPALKTHIHQFRQICTSEIEMVPRLIDFITQQPLDVPRSEIPVAKATQLPIINANFRSRLLTRLGKNVTVIGKVSEIFRGYSKDGSPHIFLNMGFWRWKCFTIVLWNEALQLFEASGKDPDDYLNQWISVTGMLTAYEHRPQILINTPSDFQLLESEEEANKLMGVPNYTTAQAVSQQTPSPSVAVEKNNKLIENTPTPMAITQNSLQRIQGSLDQNREVLEQIEKLFAGARENPNSSNPR